MKRILFLFVLISFSASMGACRVRTIKGTGSVATDNRNITAFNILDVSVASKVKVHIDAAAAPSLQITGYPNITALIKTEVVNGKLKIYYPESFNINSDGDIMIQITAPSMAGLDLSGAVDATIDGPLSATNFNIDISGACKVTMAEITAANLTTDISGSGKININGGSVQKCIYDVSGASTIKAFPLQCTEAVADVSGVGNIELTASQKLKVDISGASKVYYKGHPEVNSETSGASSLVNAN